MMVIKEGLGEPQHGVLQVQLASRWGIYHVVLGRSTARTTTGRGYRHHPLPLLLINLSDSLH
jgi:hypothetical protein